MGKEKKEKKEKTPSKSKENDDDEGGELRPVCAIAKPLADIGFHKKILKVVKKGARKTQPPPPRPPALAAPDRPMFTTLTFHPVHPSNTASKHKQVKRGVKEVVKALRKDTKG